MTMHCRPLAGCLLAAWILCATGGCGTSRRPRAAGAPPAPHPRAAALTIRSDQAGAVRLGMSRADVMALPNLTVVPDEIELEGTKSPVLRISEFGMPMAMAELDNGTVWRIQAYSPELHTEKGARVGMAAKELEQRYGPGRLLTGEGNYCAVFDAEPGVSFCFLVKRAGSQRPPSNWDQLLKQNPTVEKILITGRTAGS